MSERDEPVVKHARIRMQLRAKKVMPHGSQKDLEECFESLVLLGLLRLYDGHGRPQAGRDLLLEMADCGFEFVSIHDLIQGAVMEQTPDAKYKALDLFMRDAAELN